MERTPEQYAIEFGRYLADAAKQYMKASDDVAFAYETDKQPNNDAVTDAWRSLNEAIYEFDKRADRAYPKP